jgi:hypothetical protein
MVEETKDSSPALPEGTVDLGTTLETSSQRKILLWGRSGSGKTWSLRTLPSHCFPLAMLDMDRGSMGIRTHLAGPSYAFQPPPFNPEESAKEPVAYTQGRNWILAMQKSIKPKLWVLDSMTVFHDEVIEFCRFKGDRKPYDPTAPLDYGIALNLTKRLVRYLIATGAHVLVMAHVKSMDNEISSVAEAVPALTGKLAEYMPRMFDEIYHAEAKTVQGEMTTWWYVKPHGSFVECRTRTFHKETRIPQDFNRIFPS